jgi:hypothetical protein
MANFGELRSCAQRCSQAGQPPAYFASSNFAVQRAADPAVNMRNLQRLRHEPRKARANQHPAPNAREESGESDETAAKLALISTARAVAHLPAPPRRGLRMQRRDQITVIVLSKKQHTARRHDARYPSTALALLPENVRHAPIRAPLPAN